jgi:hypothetical protein
MSDELFKVANYLHLVPKSRMDGAVLPHLYKPSCHNGVSLGIRTILININANMKSVKKEVTSYSTKRK